MNILQNIKEFFTDIFPLHSNATVVALEDQLADALFAGSCLRSYIEVKQEQIDRAVEANVAYRKENAYLVCHIKLVLQELQDSYSRGLPSTLPVDAQVSIQEDSLGSFDVLRIRIPELRLSTALWNPATPAFAEYMGEYLGKQCAREVAAKVCETILNETCKGN